jgi:tetratricopeptide (TPR) repeat protein
VKKDFMPDNICSKCGSDLPKQTNFCPACGYGPKVNTGKQGRSVILFLTLVIVVLGGGYLIATYTDQPHNPAAHPSIPGMTGDSIPTFDQMMSNLPDDYNELVRIGNFYMDREFYPIAIECYRRALAIDSSDPDLMTDLGACYHADNRLDKAVDVLNRALTLDPEHKIACFNLGIVYKTMGYADSTKKYWNKFLELEPNSSIADTLRQILNEL